MSHFQRDNRWHLELGCSHRIGLVLLQPGRRPLRLFFLLQGSCDGAVAQSPLRRGSGLGLSPSSSLELGSQLAGLLLGSLFSLHLGLGHSLELRDAFVSLGNDISEFYLRFTKKSHVIHSLHTAFTSSTGH